MPQRISGPHHLAGAALTFNDGVVDQLIDACKSNGGVLPLSALERIKDRTRSIAVEKFSIFENAFQDSYETLAKSHGRPFSAQTGARFAVYRICHYAIEEAFKNQRARAKDWGMTFCGALVSIDSPERQSFVLAIEEAYRIVGCRHGSDLDIRIFADADEVRRPTRAYMAAIMEQLNDAKGIKMLEARLNGAIARKYNVAPPDIHLLNAVQLRTFGGRLWEDMSHGLA
ncbi:MAG: hypothetical protein AAF638_07505 [Pseudomonadota bacterium]